MTENETLNTPIDPTTVPAFPVITVEIREDHTVLVDGVAVDVEEGQTPHVAAVDAAAAAIEARGWDALRVHAIDADGKKWTMIVSAQGETMTLNDDGSVPGVVTTKPKLWRVWVPLGVGTLALLGTATAAIVLSQEEPPPPPPPVVTPTLEPRQAVELPAYPPYGATSHALWKHDLLDPKAVGVFGDQRVAILTPKGEVQILTKGRVATRVPAPSDTRKLWVTRVDGKDVILTATSKELTVWNENASPGATLPLPPQAMVTTTPNGAWVTSNDNAKGGTWIVTPNTLQQRTIPHGAKVVDVQKDTLIAADSIGHVWLVKDSSALSPTPITLQQPGGAPTPSSASAKPTTPSSGPAITTQPTLIGVIGHQDGTTAATWRNESGSMVIFYDVHGSKTKTLILPRFNSSQVDRTIPVSDPNLVVVDCYVIDLLDLKVATLPHAPVAVLGEKAYMTMQNQAAVSDLNGEIGNVTSEPRAGIPASPIGNDGESILVVVKNTLYGAQREKS